MELKQKKVCYLVFSSPSYTWIEKFSELWLTQDNSVMLDSGNWQEWFGVVVSKLGFNEGIGLRNFLKKITQWVTR